MEASQWFAEHWFDLVQTLSVVAGLLFTAYTIREDGKERKVGNLIAINELYNNIWQAFFEKPNLRRVLRKDVDLDRQPVSEEEWLFVKMLTLHLDTVRRALNERVFERIEGLQRDVREFYSLPIPRTVWQMMKPFQDDKFVGFIEAALNPVVAQVPLSS